MCGAIKTKLTLSCKEGAIGRVVRQEAQLAYHFRQKGKSPKVFITVTAHHFDLSPPQDPTLAEPSSSRSPVGRAVGLPRGTFTWNRAEHVAEEGKVSADVFLWKI